MQHKLTHYFVFVHVNIANKIVVHYTKSVCGGTTVIVVEILQIAWLSFALFLIVSAQKQ